MPLSTKSANVCQHKESTKQPILYSLEPNLRYETKGRVGHSRKQMKHGSINFKAFSIPSTNWYRFMSHIQRLAKANQQLLAKAVNQTCWHDVLLQTRRRLMTR
jgi:hypothetical protein